jgi:hypothetical protein
MEKSGNKDNERRSRVKSLRSLSVFTYLLGLMGLSFSITCAMWVYLSLTLEHLLPPLLGRSDSLLLFTGIFLLALFCSVGAWVSGVMASRRAEEMGKSGYRRWRMGLYMGIFSVMLLIVTFVILVYYSIHILMYRYQFNFNTSMA